MNDFEIMKTWIEECASLLEATAINPQVLMPLKNLIQTSWANEFVSKYAEMSKSLDGLIQNGGLDVTQPALANAVSANTMDDATRKKLAITMPTIANTIKNMIDLHQNEIKGLTATQQSLNNIKTALATPAPVAKPPAQGPAMVQPGAPTSPPITPAATVAVPQGSSPTTPTS